MPNDTGSAHKAEATQRYPCCSTGLASKPQNPFADHVALNLIRTAVDRVSAAVQERALLTVDLVVNKLVVAEALMAVVCGL